MNEKDFIEKMVNIMDTEEDIQMETVLEDIEEWDSLSYVSFMAWCSKTAKTRVEPTEVRGAKTIGELYQLIIR